MKRFFRCSIDCELPLNTPYTGGTEQEPFFGVDGIRTITSAHRGALKLPRGKEGP